MTQLFKDLNNFLKAAEANGTIPEWLAHDWVYIFTAIALLTTILSSFRKLIIWGIQWRKRRMLIKDLAPYFTKAEIFKATNNYIQTKFQNVAPSEDDEPGRSYIASAKQKLIPLFLKKAFKDDKDDNKYYLLLADAGMGKTTFMINLYLVYKRQWAWWNRKFDIKIFPLGHPETLKDVAAIPDEKKKDTILLLDALDEDSEAVKNYQTRLKKILEVAWRFREIVITCRTQFFPSRKEEPTETGYFRFGGSGGEYNFQKLYVSVFDNKDIRRYLFKRFNIWNPFIWKKLKRAQIIVKKSPDLVMRPMLLSHIDELVDHEKEYEYTFQIYEVMIEKWIEREANKPYISKAFGSSEKFKKQLLQFSQSLAINLYLNQSERGGFYIHKDEKIPTESMLQLSDLEANMEIALKESEWRSRSLLNRNAEGYYKFSHKSILEYFLAREAIEKSEFAEIINFDGLDGAKRFCHEMALIEIPDSSFDLLDHNNQKINKNLNKFPYVAEGIILRSANELNLNALKFFDLRGIKKIIVVDEKAFPNLYLIYFYYYLAYLSKVLRMPEVKERQDVRELLEQQDLQELLERLVQHEERLVQHEGLERRDLLNLLERRDLRKRLDLLEKIERLEAIDLREQIEQIVHIKQKEHIKWRRKVDLREPNLIQELNKANDFIKRCQAIEKALPNIKFIY